MKSLRRNLAICEGRKIRWRGISNWYDVRGSCEDGYDSEFFRGSIFRHSRDMRTSELKYGDGAAKSSDIICMKKCTYI